MLGATLDTELTSRSRDIEQFTPCHRNALAHFNDLLAEVLQLLACNVRGFAHVCQPAFKLNEGLDRTAHEVTNADTAR